MIRGYQDPAMCNRCARVSYKGKSVVVKIADTCPGCPRTSLDLTPAAFQRLEILDVGVLNIQWEFADCGSGASQAGAPAPVKPAETSNAETRKPAEIAKPANRDVSVTKPANKSTVANLAPQSNKKSAKPKGVRPKCRSRY